MREVWGLIQFPASQSGSFPRPSIFISNYSEFHPKVIFETDLRGWVAVSQPSKKGQSNYKDEGMA